MEVVQEIISNLCLAAMVILSLVLLIGGTICEHKFLKQVKEDSKKHEEIIRKRSDEIADGIGKELAKTLEENERLKKLSDRALLEIDRLEKAVEDLRAGKSELKKENKKLKEQLDTK